MPSLSKKNKSYLSKRRSSKRRSSKGRSLRKSSRKSLRKSSRRRSSKQTGGVVGRGLKGDRSHSPCNECDVDGLLSGNEFAKKWSEFYEKL